MKGSWGIPTIAAALICSAMGADPAPSWFRARDANFEVYSQVGAERARLLLGRFKELRAYFDQNQILPGIPPSLQHAPVRVLEFRSEREYAAVKLNATADAYYSAGSGRNYIVMPFLADERFRVAAHEYAHFILNDGGVKLPPWLSEGIAEIVSTVAISGRRCEIGGPLPERLQTLRHQPRMPVSQLLSLSQVPLLSQAEAAAFYAGSWAIADMLTGSPEYSFRFGDLIGVIRHGSAPAQAFTQVYGKSPQQLQEDVSSWIRAGGSARRKLQPVATAALSENPTPVSDFNGQALVADLLMTNREWDRAEAVYEALLRNAPDNATTLAALATLSLNQGDPRRAVSYFKKALGQGLNDPALCFRYAVVADEMNSASEETEAALNRAIELDPRFNDALYKLAQLESNRGEYLKAVGHLQAMSEISPSRAFGYWTAMAYALTELGKREEALLAIKEGNRFAANSEDRARMQKLALIAQTDVAVRFKREANGNVKLETTRVPHNDTSLNPFVEAGDDVHVVSARLREVQCGDGKLTALVVEGASGLLNLSVENPAHILIRHGPSEFVCGPQESREVKVEFAAVGQPNHGILRGLAF